MDVISDPAYVVGTATIGSSCSSATALASPIVDPPPMASSASAFVSRARAHRLDRDMHRGDVAGGREQLPEPALRFRPESSAGRRDHQDTAITGAGDLVGQAIERLRGENHATRRLFVNERPHR
jgi:hypothetical protein